jgi:hypothetical protein
MTYLLCLHQSVLVLQRTPKLPPGITQERYEHMMAYWPFYLVLGLAISVGCIWALIDVWKTHGTGWGVASCLGCLFLPFAWVVAIIYLLIRLASGSPGKRLETGSGSSYGEPSAVYGGGQPAAPQDLELAPAERDERIDGLLAEGKAREAMDAAQEMLKMARDFKDAGGQKRYAKYVERIRLGIK